MAKQATNCPSCGQPLEVDPAVDRRVTCPSCQGSFTIAAPSGAAAPKDPLLGQTLGQFEVLEVVGRGGMGTVYKARQESLDRIVALKVLPRSVSADAAYIERFRREARAAAAVSHPNIIEVYSVGQDGAYQYMAMEFVAGESLGRRLVREGRIPVAEAASIMRQVAAALAQAHAAGLIHRDIKPSNILLGTDGRAKVVDFGVAKRMEEDVHLTRVGRIVGTVLYMAPEVAGGGHADARSDLYSLGATFYYALAGVTPFQGSSSTELAIKHAQAPVPPLAERAPEASPGLCQIVHRLLAKNPAERFASAGELVEALETVDLRPPASAAAAAAAAHVSLGQRLGVRKRRSRQLLLIGAAAGAVGLIVLALMVFLSPGGHAPATPPPEQAVAPPPAVPEPKPPVPEPPPQPRPPAWGAAMAEADARAKVLVGRQRFAEAIDQYEDIARRFAEPRVRELADQSIADLRRKADQALADVEKRVAQLVREKSYADARQALAAVIATFGVPDKVKAAQDGLLRIDEAEAAAKAEAARAREQEEARKAAAEKRRQAEALYAQAIKPIDALVEAWDFQAAVQAIDALKLDAPEVRQRAADRRAELERLAALKARMIERINKATPPLQRSTLHIPGLNADLAKADDRGIDAKLPNDGVAGMPWRTLGARSAQILAELTIDPTKADDWLAAGLLSLTLDDAASAEKAMEKARGLGADVDRYMTPIAAAAFEQARAHIEEGRLDEAAAALDQIEKRFAKANWLPAHAAEVAAARKAIDAGRRDAEAEKLYARAAALFKQKDLFELKPLVEKLSADFASAKAADPTRQPSLAEMAKATAGLGRRLTVRKDGKGDHTSIQDAIQAAPANSLIEVDDGTWCEALYFADDKKGLTVSGAKDAWPVLTSQSGAQQLARMVVVAAPDVTLRHLVITHTSTRGGSNNIIEVNSRQNVRLQSVVLYSPQTYGYAVNNSMGTTELDHCIVAVPGGFSGAVAITNCHWLTPQVTIHGYTGASRIENSVLASLTVYGRCDVRTSTFIGLLHLSRGPNAIVDSIISQVRAVAPDTQITHCDLFGKQPYQDFARPGANCFSAPPQFVDPVHFSFKLKPSSPCRKRASDGGDLGCRLTPQMIEMLKLAFELRRKGIITFTF